MHQGAWIVWAVCAGVITMLTTNPFYLMPMIAVCSFVYATQRRSDVHARAFRIFLTFGALTIVTRTALVLFSTVTVDSVAVAASEGLRLATLLIVFGTFNSVADPYGVLRLAPRRFHEPALAAALALSMTPRTMEAVGNVREAQRLRGVDIRGPRTLSAVAVPVLATGLEQALTLAESMDARGHGRGRRTRYRRERWGEGATVTLVAAAVGLIGAFILGDAAGSGLHLPSPLALPDVAPAMLACYLVFAVPGIAGSK